MKFKPFKQIKSFLFGTNYSFYGGSIGGNYRTAIGASSTSGLYLPLERALYDATIVSCTNVLAQSIAQLPLTASKKSINNLLHNPNGVETPYDFKYSIVMSLLLWGDCFLRIKRNSAGQMVYLAQIPTELITIAVENGKPTYTLQDDAPIPAEDLIHIKDINTIDSNRTRSRVVLASDRIAALKSADKQIGNVFKNGLQTNLHAKPSGDNTTNDEMKVLAENLREASGVQNDSAGTITVGNYDLVSIKGTTPMDTDLRSMRLDLINEIAALFRVPPHMVGGKTDVKYSNLLAAQNSFYKDTIYPLCVNIQDCLAKKLADPSIKFDMSALTRGSDGERAAVSSTNADIMTINERRAYIGLDALPADVGDVIANTAPGDKNANNDEENT